MMRHPIALCLGLWLAWAGALPADATNPDERLDNPALEARARDLSKELRCLVCQNQSIDDSNADHARDMRVLVRERLLAGDTDDEVLTYLTDRYGAFVRLRPPVTSSTVLLWGLPALVVALALLGFGLYLRSRRAAATPEAGLSADEEAELNAILKDRREA